MSKKTPFPVVGIGASAGGLDAFEHLFRHLPSNPGCAIVIVTHLHPDRRSQLPELLARWTDLPVSAAEDGQAVAANRVYVMPEETVLGISGGRLRLRRLAPAERERKPIDIFLSALAKDFAEYSVGVILSGADGDGTLGIKAIKEHGGITFAQISDGHAPQFPDMPQSAIASGMVDLAIPITEMGQRFADLAASLKSSAKGLAAIAEVFPGGIKSEIFEILRTQMGHDFSGYKTKTVLRRIQRRMQINNLASPADYLALLRADTKEVQTLFRDFLINVTDFFRDADAFDALARDVIPKLFENRAIDDPVRVWVPGCATGEEVFSIAILLREHVETLEAPPRVQIFATDIDEHSLGVARAARYPEALLDNVSDERRKRFFVCDGGSYVIEKSVREMCTFSPHNIIRDSPFSRIDLVSCRNLLIYFGTDVQDQVIPTFHYALRPEGYLFLGTSESVTQFGDLFVSADRKQRIFRKRQDSVNALKWPIAPGGYRLAGASRVDGMKRRQGMSAVTLRHSVEAQIVARFAPAHVVINRNGDIVYYSSHTGKYLEAVSGAPTRQILSLARKGLQLDLRILLREAIDGNKRVIREGVAIETDDGRMQPIAVTVEPLADSGEDKLFIVAFADIGPAFSAEALQGRSALTNETALQLENDLRDTRERLQASIEEYETALEELTSSNEELVSVNEELQSANEELEASKEELQSLNEEMHTVNIELGSKVDALDRANNDLRNLFESTQVATVFLDGDLVIRSFTPAATKIFNILPTDRGRPITDLATWLNLPTLKDDVTLVFTKGESVERSISYNNGDAHYLVRSAPYRVTDEKIEGVLLTFVDVTTLTQAEAHQRVLIAELNHRVKNMLAIAIGIAELTYKTTADPAQFKTAFVNRLRAMARSYELLSRENWLETSLEDLARSELAPFGLDRVALKGAEVRLRPKQATSAGMILHELATNAAKYGALSAPEGNVEIFWDRSKTGDATILTLTWRERGGPPVTPPAKTGFGLQLIGQEAGYSLGGKAEIEFDPSGVVATLSLSVDNGDESAG